MILSTGRSTNEYFAKSESKSESDDPARFKSVTEQKQIGWRYNSTALYEQFGNVRGPGTSKA